MFRKLKIEIVVCIDERRKKFPIWVLLSGIHGLWMLEGSNNFLFFFFSFLFFYFPQKISLIIWAVWFEDEMFGQHSSAFGYGWK